MSPLITNPEFAIHEGINCGPLDDNDELRDLDVDLDGVGILEIISSDLALCAYDGVVDLLFMLDCLDIGVCCRDDDNDGGSFVFRLGDLLGVLNNDGDLLYCLDVWLEYGDPINCSRDSVRILNRGGAGVFI